VTGSEIMAAFRKAAGDDPKVIEKRIVVRSHGGIAGTVGVYDFKPPHLRLVFDGQEGELMHVDGRRERATMMVDGRRVEVPLSAIKLPEPAARNGNGNGKPPETRKRKQSRRMPSQNPAT